MGARRTLLAICMALVTMTSPAGAETTEVQTTDPPTKRFSPDRVSVAVGDSVHWSSNQGNHNVREDGRLFYSGPVSPSTIDFTATFSAGTFHYFCESHGGKKGGMDGIVKVGVEVTSSPSGNAFTVRWATSTTTTGKRFDVQFRVGSAKWQSWMKSASAFSAVFGKRGDPAPAQEGTKYSFRARSKKKDKTSRWSPVTTFSP